MDFNVSLSFSDPRIRFSNYLSAIKPEKTVESIIEGLTSTPRRISSIYLYDAAGSRLFQQITRLPEYYLSRIETELIREFSSGNKDFLRDLDIIEFGSGDCSKISIILDAIGKKDLDSICYSPMDISLASLKESAETIVAKYPGINVHCIAANILDHSFRIAHDRKKLFCFFGSTIGNFSKEQRIRFLRNAGMMMYPGDLFLLGVDMVKKKEYLESAYNDRCNITARFNRNILNVINSMTGSDFNPLLFDHCALYNGELCRIEMYLRAQRAMTVSFPRLNNGLFIKKNETIHTESSYKFTIKAIENDISAAGLKSDRLRTDDRKWFSLLQIIRDAA